MAQNIITKTKGKKVFVQGKVKWANIIEPNQYGSFNVCIYPEPEVLENFIQVAEKMRDEAAKEVEEAGKKIQALLDIVKEDEEGNEYIQAKLKEEEFGKKQTIEVIGKDGQLIENFDKLIGNGSELNVRVWIKPYYNAMNKSVGISIKFYAVQIIDMIEYGSGNGFINLTEDK